MQNGVLITPQEAMEPVLNEELVDYESRLWLKAVKIKLSLPQQIVEEHEHVRDTTHPPKHYGCIYVTRPLYEVTFPMSYRNVDSSCPHYRERRRSLHRTDSDALYAVGGGLFGHGFDKRVYALLCGGRTEFKLPKAGNGNVCFLNKKVRFARPDKAVALQYHYQ